MNQESQQVIFFQQLKSQIPPNISLVDLISEVLNLSTDSAYRRIRGEKPLEFNEIQKLCSKFHLSFDQFISLKKNTYVFSGDLPTEIGYKMSDWLESMKVFFEYVNGFDNKHFYWFVRDLPVFIHFQVPELSAFKFFFWSRSILDDDRLRNIKFSIHIIDRFEKDIEKGKRISRLYNEIPTSEIWNAENISATLRQLEYYKQINAFESQKDYEMLYDKLVLLIDHVEKQAEIGKKFFFGEKVDETSVNYNLYKNDLVLGDATSVTEIDNAKITWMVHGFINIMSTMDPRFNQYAFKAMKNLIRKSALISVTNELERKRFFNLLRGRIQQSRNG